MKKLLMSAFIASAFFANVSFAQGPGWTGVSTVKNIVVTYPGGINVSLSPGLTGCQSQSGYGATYASIMPSHPGKELFQSNLLTAQTTGKQVKLYLGDDKCTVLEMILLP